MKKYYKLFLFSLISVLSIAKGLESNEELLSRMKEDPLSVEQAILASTDIQQFSQPYISISGSLPSDVPASGCLGRRYDWAPNPNRKTLFINELMCMDTSNSSLTPTVRKVASYLLDQNLDPLGHRDVAALPFHVAFQRGHFSVAKKILEKIYEANPYELKVGSHKFNPFIILAECQHPGRALDDMSNEPRDWLIEFAAFFKEKWPQETQRYIDDMVSKYTLKTTFGFKPILILERAVKNRNKSLINFILEGRNEADRIMKCLIEEALEGRDEDRALFIAQLVLENGYNVDSAQQDVLDLLYKVAQTKVQDYIEGRVLEEDSIVAALLGAIDFQIGHLNLSSQNAVGETIFNRAEQLGHTKIAECASRYLEQYEIFSKIDLGRRQKNLKECLELGDYPESAKKCIRSAIEKRIPGLDLNISYENNALYYWKNSGRELSELGIPGTETFLHRAVTAQYFDLIELAVQYINEQASWVR